MNKIGWGRVIGILITVALLGIPFALPLFHFASDIKTVLTVISLLFAILAGFFIGTATSNYLRLQTLIANANAGMITVFNLAKLIQPSCGKKIADAIDRYTIAILDYDLLEYSSATQKEFDEVVKAVDEVTPEEGKGTHALLSELHKVKDNLFSINCETSLAVKRVVTPRHWFILVALAALIAMLLLSLRDGQWFFSLVVGVLLLALYQILKLLREIDTNLFLAKKLSYEAPQQIFRAIGALPYYPEIALTDRRVKEPKESYRIGIYKDYPRSFEKEIKIVRKKP